MTGRLLMATSPFTSYGITRDGPGEKVYDPGTMVCDEPGVAHAWKAIKDTEVLVFTRGPRSGEDYESDTERLKVPLL
jgi:quercetin dioxygenase-like cupin family protein